MGKIWDWARKISASLDNADKEVIAAIASTASKIISGIVVATVLWAAATLRSIEIGLTKQDAKIDRIAEVSGIKLDNIQKDQIALDCRLAKLESGCHKGGDNNETAIGRGQ